MSTANEAGHRITRVPVSVRGFALLGLSFQTLGIIYSDIGTSPLYVLNGLWPANASVPSEEDVVGGISAIIWSLTLLPLLKYVVICLRFGTHEGEGGTFALYQGLYPPAEKDFDADRTLTGFSFTHSLRDNVSTISKSLRWPLLAWSLLGTSLTLSDGIFTPAVSVTSAVSGIAVAKPSVSHDVVPISVAFLVFLFLIQSRGTAWLATLFAPLTFLWLSLLAGTGIANIVHHPGIFRAFDPSRAIMLFVRTRNYDLLSGILLSITGCEALFANLGQFNMASIQISFCSFVYPCLILAYLGQGARLIADGEAVLPNIFYNTIPGPSNGPLFWIIYVFAIIATLIASQALITATFSLVQQLINMHSLPQLRMVYTSSKSQGQVFIPIINYALMVLVIIMVAAFHSDTSLTNAYGFAVATVMFVTTVLIALQMKYVKRLPIVIAIGFLATFGFLDGLFWGAALKKVPHGAWVPLMIGLLLMIFMLFWTWARGLEEKFDGSNRINLRYFIHSNAEDEQPLVHKLEQNSPRADDVGVRIRSNNGSGDIEESGDREKSGTITESEDGGELEEKQPAYYFVDGNGPPGLVENRRELVRISSCAIFHKSTMGKGVPHSFVGFIRQWPALPRVVIFLSVRVLPTASIAPEERYAVTKVRSIQGFYGVTYFLGFRDDFDAKVSEIVDRICALEIRADPLTCAATVDEIRKITSSYTHIVPHYHVLSKHVDAGRLSGIVNWFRRILIEDVYRPLVTMFPETENWITSGEEIIRVGINARI